jgi:LexA-binding, inner membrane-associated putative hydrolase
MSSVLGHGLAGMTVWALARRAPALRTLDHKGWWVAAAAAGCLPDLDSLVGLPHRGPTHTLGFAIAAGALAAAALAAAGRRREALWIWPAFAWIVWLHPMMDLLNGGGPSVALCAPLWSHSFSPVAGGLPLHGYTHDWTDLGGLLFESRTLQGMLIEAAIFGPLFAATVVKRRPLDLALGGIGAVVWISFAVFS